MKKEFRLPDVGEGLTEADIVSWHVKPGDTVTINQIIVDIETAKAVVELPSPYAGTVSALLVERGADGRRRASRSSRLTCRAQAETEPSQPESPASDPKKARRRRRRTRRNGARQPVLVGYGVKPGSTSRRPRKKPPTRPGSYPATPSAPPTGGPPPAARPGIRRSPPGSSFRLAFPLRLRLSSPAQTSRPSIRRSHRGRSHRRLRRNPHRPPGSGRAFCGRTPRGGWGGGSPSIRGVTGGSAPGGKQTSRSRPCGALPGTSALILAG